MSTLSFLTYLFKKSIESGIFPQKWKQSNVVPVFKQGDTQIVSNYRPISLLCNLSKVFEKIVYNCLYDYCIENNLLSVRKSGFKKGDGTVNRLIYITNNIYKALDAGEEVAMVFLDISKAFDKVWIQGLLHKLEKFGVSGNLLEWLRSYLTSRSQKTVLSGNCLNIKNNKGPSIDPSGTPAFISLIFEHLPDKTVFWLRPVK